jgi:hypothetical protein
VEVWEVPKPTVVTGDLDHFGLLVRLCRKSDAPARIMETLDRVASASQGSPTLRGAVDGARTPFSRSRPSFC